MSDNIEVTVPDMGDFSQVDVIDILVQPGDAIEPEQSLITLETDKATMDVPAPDAGKVTAIHISVGDKVSAGDAILTLEAASEASATAATDNGKAPPVAARSQPAPNDAPPNPAQQHTEVLVLGAGPGGYTAAFRAADLGKQVTLVERDPYLGGVCLNVGCIPSKALLHIAAVIDETATLGAHGVTFARPTIDLDKLRGFKNKVIGQLTGGLKKLAEQRQVAVVQGHGRFSSPRSITVEQADGESLEISFDYCIIAAGSRPIQLPGIPYDDPRVWGSTRALELANIPERMLVIGGGIIGMEMATVYAALGSRITVAELADGLMPGADRDLIRAYQKHNKKRYENIFLQTKVTQIDTADDGLTAHFDGPKAPASERFDNVLVAVGRRSNTDHIAPERAGLKLDDHGYISVDQQMRSNVGHIFAIGDIVGQPQLAHKATHEGKVAAEVIAGLKSGFDDRVIPSVAYTDPEIAWVGLTETAANEQGIAFEKASFPWAASGRALSMGRSEGVTKLLFDPESGRVLGAGIAGIGAGELIAEATLAIEMGADAQDMGLTIHPHPTLSETVNFAAEMFEGTITDLYVPKKQSGS